VVADPHTGEVLAMADAGFATGAGDRHAGRPYRSHAVTWLFEPGSIFKPVVVALLLEAGLTHPDALVFAENGTYQVADRTFHEASGHSFAWMSAAHVLQRSSNIGMVKLAEPMTSRTLYRGLRKLGFGEKTGIDYPGEASGLLRPPKRWSLVSQASMSIGQEIAVGPLQMVTFYSALANGGLRLRPSLVRAIRDPTNGRRPPRPPARPERVLSRATTEQMTRILTGVVGPKGTAPKAAVDGFAVAGKTGTAQKYDRRRGGYSTTRFVSSFIGYLPADRPRLTILISLDEPRDGAYGGQVAAPIFREIATHTLRHLGVRPESSRRTLEAAPRGRPPRLASLTL
jgi:cell division protein FtsI (penicillin-binding protein 3)